MLVGQFSSFTAVDSAFIGNDTAVSWKRLAGGEPLASAVSLTRTVLRRNEDGVYLRLDSESSVALQETLATDNTRYGIYAPGATDLGGNRAAGNGRPCVGVVCSTP